MEKAFRAAVESGAGDEALKAIAAATGIQAERAAEIIEEANMRESA